MEKEYWNPSNLFFWRFFKNRNAVWRKQEFYSHLQEDRLLVAQPLLFLTFLSSSCFHVQSIINNEWSKRLSKHWGSISINAPVKNAWLVCSFNFSHGVVSVCGPFSWQALSQQWTFEAHWSWKAGVWGIGAGGSSCYRLDLDLSQQRSLASVLAETNSGKRISNRRRQRGVSGRCGLTAPLCPVNTVKWYDRQPAAPPTSAMWFPQSMRVCQRCGPPRLSWTRAYVELQKWLGLNGNWTRASAS